MIEIFIANVKIKKIPVRRNRDIRNLPERKNFKNNNNFSLKLILVLKKFLINIHFEKSDQLARFPLINISIAC